MPVAPEDKCERLEDAGCLVGNGVDCGALERVWPTRRGQLPLSSSSTQLCGKTDSGLPVRFEFVKT